MGLKLKIEPNIESGLKLVIDPLMSSDMVLAPESTISYVDVLDFDGSHNILLSSAGYSSDMAGNKKITWNMLIDNSEGYSAEVFIHMIDNAGGNNVFDVGLDGSLFHIKGYRGGSWNYYYEIGNNYGKVIECEVNKTDTGVASFKIGDVTQSGTYDTANYGSLSVGWYFGYNDAVYLDNATLWDIKLYDTDAAGVLTHSWKGTPDASINAGWVDDVSTFDGTVQGDDPRTRNIEL